MAVVPLSAVSPILDDRPAETDALGFEPYCNTLVDILCDADTHTPLTVGLFGTWGSGKTSLMSMIKTQIEQADLPTFHSVWFNAWKYGQEEALWRALILRVLDALRPQRTGELSEAEKTLVQDLDRLEESLYRTVEWQEVGRWTLDWAKALRGTAEGAAEIALAFVPGGAPLLNLVKSAAKAVTGEEQQAVAEAFRRQVRTYRREQLRSLEQFEGEFRKLLKQHVVGPENGRLIIFVDDLDRCLPEKAIEVLEAIKLFLDVPGCVFVLGLDEEAIVDAVQTRDAGEIKGRQYLEKIIQLPFRLPPIETKDMHNFVDSLVPHLPDRRCSEVFAEGLPQNPRQVKRTINIFLLLWRLAHQALPEAIQPVRLAKVVAIQHSEPDLYALLCEVPRLLHDLEVHFRAEAERLEQSETGLEAETEAQDQPAVPSLTPQLQPFARRAGLRRLLTLHAADMQDVNFIDLTPQEIRPYIYLTRRAEPRPETRVELPEPQMVRIPAGTFTMGNEAHETERPRHQVYLPDYQIGRFPVTNFEYRAYVRDAGAPAPRHWEGENYPEEMGDYPVVYINWYNAVAYCQWLSRKTGKPYHLPTEAEWEKAARGEDERTWPWGNDWEQNKCNSKESGVGQITPVGQYSPQGDSPYGAADMAGNIWEWCSSLFQVYPYSRDSGREDLDAAGDRDRVLRGGAFLNENRFVRCTYRYERLPNSHDGTTGFRVALGTG